jgi:hypothetical protein
MSTLSIDTINLARQKVKLLSEKMDADRERLVQDDLKVAEFKNEAYWRFVKMLDGEELPVGLKTSVWRGNLILKFLYVLVLVIVIPVNGFALSYINGATSGTKLVLFTEDMGDTVLRSGIGRIEADIADDGTFTFQVSTWQAVEYYVYKDGDRLGKFVIPVSDFNRVYMLYVFDTVELRLIYSENPLVDVIGALRRATGE